MRSCLTNSSAGSAFLSCADSPLPVLRTLPRAIAAALPPEPPPEPPEPEERFERNDEARSVNLAGDDDDDGAAA